MFHALRFLYRTSRRLQGVLATDVRRRSVVQPVAAARESATERASRRPLPPPSLVQLKCNGVILVLAKRCRPKPCEEGGSLAAVFTHARVADAQAPRRREEREKYGRRRVSMRGRGVATPAKDESQPRYHKLT
ncbi:hypothetical protein J6590_020836 [Homalodisca vitripennis]|nr:hypothetical protein J6590_020836 [Homalodisca vitripennis]